MQAMSGELSCDAVASSSERVDRYQIPRLLFFWKGMLNAVSLQCRPLGNVFNSVSEVSHASA